MTYGFQNERDATDAAKLIRQSRQYGNVTHTEPIRQSSSGNSILIDVSNELKIIAPARLRTVGTLIFGGTVLNNFAPIQYFGAFVRVTGVLNGSTVTTGQNQILIETRGVSQSLSAMPVTTSVTFSFSNTSTEDVELSYTIDYSGFNIPTGTTIITSNSFSGYSTTWVYKSVDL